MTGNALRFAFAALSALGLIACVSVTVTDDQPKAAANGALQFEQDRKAILAMTGTYSVRFDFRETVAIESGYQLKPPKLSGGEEVVFVVADTGRFISLQHILVVGPKSEPMVVKHWRQDWSYEPKEVLAFVGRDTFDTVDVPASAQAGEWSQTVYQVDDSPRYGGYGKWVHEGGASTWESNVSWRPLPRRDDTTRTDYQVVVATNRHTITPKGWTHEQDNSKQVLAADGVREIVREVGVNTYTSDATINRKVVDDYWAKTKDLWIDVRAVWGRLAADGRAFTVADDPEGSELYTPVLEAADKLAEGEIDGAKARAEVIAYIKRQTSGPAAVAIASAE